MAIKYNNTAVTNINYNSQTVKKLVLDNEVRWEKPFVLSESKAPGCSVSYNRTATNEPSAKTGTISAGTIYNEDVIKITYSPSTYYVIDTFTVNGTSFVSGNSLTVSGNVSVVCTTKGVAQTITVTKNTGVAKINVTYVNIYGTQTTVSFTASGSITDAWQSTNYSWDATAETGYTMASSAGSGTVGTSTTIAPTASLNSYTITWKYLTAYPNTWGTTQQTYNYGATPSRPAAATVTNTSDNERKTFNSWNNLAPVTSNRTIEAVYNQEYYITCSGTRCTSSSSSWKADGATFTATWNSSTNCAFNAAGSQTSATQSITVSGAPATYTKSADYIYVTIGGSNNASIVKYGTTTAAATGWHSYNQRLTYNPDAYYSYAAGTTQTSKSDVYLTTPGGTYSYSPTYIRAASIATGTYNASVNRNASTYYAASTTIVWSANNTHSYGGSAVSDNSSPVTLTAGGTFSAPTPGYTKITVTATRSTIKVGSTTRDSGWSGIVANGTTITWTASTDYSFAAGTAQDATRTADVAVSTLTYAKSADYKNITVAGTHCSSNIATGYRHLGDTIVWTGSSGTNYKYGFSNSDHTATTNSAAGTNAGVISTDYATYTNTAGYLWYNITSITGTHCTAYTNDSYNTQYTTGWHLSTANIYWKITTTGYCFDQNSNSQTDTKAPVAGDNSRTTNLLCRYVLTISVTNPSYGSYSVKRGTTVLNNGDYIYYGDALTGAHSKNPDSGTSWNPWPTVTAPSATTTGAATSGNLTVKNEDSATCTLYYNTTNSTSGATSLGSVATGATKYKDGLSFNTTYYLFATKSITRTGSHYTYSDSSTYSGTASVTGNVTATFAFGRTTVSDSESKTGYSSITSKATAAQTYYTITFNRARQDANGCQSLATAVADTSIGVASVSVPYGGSYSETFSKTNFTSQTKSGSNVTASTTVNVTLIPVTYSLGASLTQWTGGWYTNSSYTGSTIGWMYHGNTAYFRATPNSRYGQTVSNVWYYNGKYYSTTTTNATGSVSLSATAITYTVTASLTNAAVTLGTNTSSYSASLSKTYAELYTGNPNIYFKITPNVHYGMTIGSTWYYNGNPLSGSGYYITGNSFSFSDANKTATYGLSSTTYAVSAITYTVSGGTSANGSVSWTNNTYGNNATWTITPNTGYNAPSPATGNKAITTDNFTISDANKTAAYKGGAFDPCVIKSYTITVTGSNCTITVGGTARASGWSGTVNHFTEIKWTPTTYYSFDAGSTQTSKTATVTGAGTYSNSPTAVRAASIATGTYNASVNRNASTYYAAGTKPTWTAAANYYYGSSSTDTTYTGSAISAGAAISAPNPTYIKCTLSGTRCSPSPASGSIIAVGSNKITWTASDGYSFAEGTTRTATAYSNVVLGTTSYSKSANYKNITVTGTNCSANVTDGYRLLGATITWTASSGTDYRYSFSNSDSTDSTRTATVTTDTSSYSKTAGYLYYNVTITVSSGYSANYSSGYILNGTAVTFTAPANSDSKRYSFSTSDSAIHTQSKTISSAGQALANDTASVWMNCSCSGTNCSATNGWYRVGTSITWTATSGTNYRYGFQSATNWSDSYATATSTVVENTTSYAKTASYLYYNVTISPKTNSTANVSSGYRLSGTLVTFTTTTATGSIRYSFSTSVSDSYIYSDSTATTGTKVDSAGKTITGPTVYIWYYITVNANSGSSVTSNGSGWYRSSSTAVTSTWTVTDTAAYTFASNHTQQNTITDSWTPDQSKTISAKTVYARYYTVTFSNSEGSWSTASAWVSYGTTWTTSGTTVTLSGSQGSSTYTKAEGAGYTTTATISPTSGTVNSNKTITGTTNWTAITYTITWKYLSAYPDTWATATQTYHYNDTPSRTSPGDVQGTGSSSVFRKHFSNWDDLSAVTASRTITAVYESQGYVDITFNHCTSTTASGWYQESRSFHFTATADADWSFNGSTTGDSKLFTKSCPGTFTIEPAYCQITVTNPSNATADVSSGIVANGTVITFSPATYYSYNAGTTQTSTTVTVNGPSTYTASSPQYGRAQTVTLTRCTAGDDYVNKYHSIATPRTITFTSNTGYAFTNGGTTTASSSWSPGGTVSKTAGYVRVTFFNGDYHEWNATSTLWAIYNSSITRSGDSFTIVTDFRNPTVRTVSAKSTNPPYYIYSYSVNYSGNVTAARTLTITSSQSEPSTTLQATIQGNWLAVSSMECVTNHTGPIFGASGFNLSANQFNSTQQITTGEVLTFTGLTLTNSASSSTHLGLRIVSSRWGGNYTDLKFDNPNRIGLRVNQYTIKLRQADNPGQIWATKTISSTSSQTFTLTREQAYHGILIDISISYREEFAHLEFTFRSAEAMDHMYPAPSPDWSNYLPYEIPTSSGYDYGWDYMPLYLKYALDDSDGSGFTVTNPYTGLKVYVYSVNAMHQQFDADYHGGTTQLSLTPKSIYELFGSGVTDDRLDLTGR